jgi:hypothetical protein
LRDELKQIVPDTTGIGEQLQQVRVKVEELTLKSAPKVEPEHETIVNLQSYREVQPCEPSDETDNEPETHPTPRITVNLKQERSATKRETQREPAKGNETAQQRARRILKRYPDITASDLAKKAQITPQYASRILKKSVSQ